MGNNNRNKDNNEDQEEVHETSNENNDMDHLEVYADDEQQRKSSISFDKIKQISLTYSLQSEDDDDDDEGCQDENTEADQDCNCRRGSSCSNCAPVSESTQTAEERRKPSVIEVKKSTTTQEVAFSDSRSVPDETLFMVNAEQSLGGCKSNHTKFQRREENPSSTLTGRDHDTLARAETINSPRYLRSNPFTRDVGLDYDGAGGNVHVNNITGSPSTTVNATANHHAALPNALSLDARGDQEADVYNDWPKQYERSESKLDHPNTNSDHTFAQGQSLSTSSRLTNKLNNRRAAPRISQSSSLNQTTGHSMTRNSDDREFNEADGFNPGEGYQPGKVRMLNSGDNSTLGLRLRQHNNSVLSLVVYNESDANVLVSDEPESFSDDSYWGSAAIESELATVGIQHNINVEYSSEEEFLEDHNHRLALQNRNLNTNGDQIRDANNAIHNMAAENERRPKQTPPQQQQQLSYPIQRPSNRRVESLSQHDLENQASRRSVSSQYGSNAETTTAATSRADNGYHRIDSESMHHIDRACRQTASDLDRNLQTPNYRQHSEAFSPIQGRVRISNQDFEGSLFSPIGSDQNVDSSTTMGRADPVFENIRPTIDDGAQIPLFSRTVQYQGTARNQLLAR